MISVRWNIDGAADLGWPLTGDLTPTDDLDFGSILRYFELGNFFGSELESLTIDDWTIQAQFWYGLLFQLLASDENFEFDGVAPPAGDAEYSEFVAGIPFWVQT